MKGIVHRMVLGARSDSQDRRSARVFELSACSPSIAICAMRQVSASALEVPRPFASRSREKGPRSPVVRQNGRQRRLMTSV